MTRLLLVALGGAVGSVARYGLVLWSAAAFGPSFPWGTLLANLGGSFLLGFVMHLATTTHWIGPDLRLALTTGALGGFTTYSTFNYETTALFRSGAWLQGAINLAVTVAGCMFAGIAGLVLARVLAGR